jgi:hypothetical protein
MSINSKLWVLTPVLMLLVASPNPAFAGPKRKVYRTHHQRSPAAREYAPSLRRLPGGDYVDRNGWRYRQGYGWDNTCFHLDYLDSQFACNAGGGRR